jgi:hypothetical protein
MRELEADFVLDETLFNSRMREIEGLDVQRKLDSDDVRHKVADAGLVFREFKPSSVKGGLRLLAGDSSIVKRELRHHALWAFHGVTVCGVCDGKLYEDKLVGEGRLPYRGLMYESDLDLGAFIPYSDVDERLNSIRVGREFSMLLESKRRVESECGPVDFLLVDGSLYTNLRNLEAKKGYSEHAAARNVYQNLLKERVVGMVEDSHATDLSRSLGFNATNMLLFETALKPLEYAVDTRDEINICYMKLPGKEMASLPAGKSSEITVRWEFNYAGFHEDLELLAGVWVMETDILHPQLYPIRISDYLTRRIKVSGLIDRIVEGKKLAHQYRDLREGLF